MKNLTAMKKLLAFPLVAAALFVVGAGAAEANSCSVVSTAGYCGVKFGVNEEKARASYAGTLSEPEGVDAEERESCYYLSDESADAAFMIVRGIVERVDVFGRSVATQAGAKIGMAFDDVAALYPDATKKPNPYDYPLEDLHADLGGGVFAVFEQDERGRVRHFRIGRKPAVDYIEGCS